MPAKLSASKTLQSKVNPTKALSVRVNATHTNTMPTPNTSIQSTLILTDANGTFINTLSSCGLTVKFPDGSTQTLGLSTGIINAGNGQYQASYNTKGVGVVVENWSVVAASGDVGNFQYDIGVGF